MSTGFHKPSSKELTAAMQKRAIELRAEGLTFAVIGRRLGVTATRAFHLFKRGSECNAPLRPKHLEPKQK